MVFHQLNTRIIFACFMQKTCYEVVIIQHQKFQILWDALICHTLINYIEVNLV